jgi:hypothetical protein
MRVNVSHRFSLAAAILLAGCNSPTGLGPVEESTGIQVMTVTPSHATIVGGRFIQLKATVVASGGGASTPPDVTWSSADSCVATVRPDGLVMARKAGWVKIVATWHEARGSAVVIVLDQVGKKPLEPARLKQIRAAEENLIPGGVSC